MSKHLIHENIVKHRCKNMKNIYNYNLYNDLLTSITVDLMSQYLNNYVLTS